MLPTATIHKKKQKWLEQEAQLEPFLFFFVNYKHSHGCWQGTGPI